MAGATTKEPCHICQKGFGKGKNCINEESIKCCLCDLWLHKRCSGISEGTYNYVKEQEANGEDHVWACKSCSSAFKKFNCRLLKVEKKVEKLETDVNTNSDKIEKVSEKVEMIDKDIKDLKNSERSSVNTKDEILREMAERDAKKDNIVIHNLPEPDNTVTEGEARKKCDQSALSDLLKTINIEINHDKDVKFIKRAGERTEQCAPRPLLVGFWENKKKEDIMKSAKLLSKSKYKHTSIVPDLTKNQRNLESDMRKEAENLTADMESEEAKNWEYRLVGIKGRREIRKVRRRKDQTTYQPTNSRKRPADHSHRQSREAQQENRDTDVEVEEEEYQDQSRRNSSRSPPGKQARR